MNTDIRYGRNRKGIKKELNEKIEDWLTSIEDEAVREIAKENVIVTGGSIASMLLGEKVNDFDLYFKTKQATLAIALYYVDKYNKANPISESLEEGEVSAVPIVKEETIANIKGENEERIVIFIKSAGVAGEAQEKYKYFETQTAEATEAFADSLQPTDETGDKYHVSFMSQNAITLSHKVQLVIRFYGSPDKIHDNYDFIHAMCYYDYSEKNLELPAESLEALLSRTLKYKGSLYPIASVFRTKKFLERGWRISAGEQLKMMWQISEINLKDFEVMREQLTGVDMAYLHQLITALEGTDPEKITSAYIATIIDRIFE